MRAQIRWELGDPYNLIVFIFGFIMLGITFFSSLTGNDVVFMVTGPDGIIVSESAKTLGLTLPRLGTEEYTIFALTGALLVSLMVRYDRDTRVAKSVYSLPVRNHSVVLSKALSAMVLLLLASILPAFLAFIYIHGDVPDLIGRALFDEGFLAGYLLYWAMMVLYVVSLSALVAMLSPNTFASLLGSITLLYVPLVLKLRSLPPAVIDDAFFKAYTTQFYPSDRIAAFLDGSFHMGLLLPAVMLGVALILSEWRDVS
ncbi:ABC transporter permease [Thermococcus sp. 21S7]|uniref:ABC transporter permease n=1 Tax=Thermococcus sp. 21S7 TaxID=1638221 RepID=UPI00143939F2|nr:ABC transporter permease [Thermococcus sp. 21S7]NJE60734.1 ABC transporter permease [Thermococcus sp. 21S7]